MEPSFKHLNNPPANFAIHYMITCIILYVYIMYMLFLIHYLIRNDVACINFLIDELVEMNLIHLNQDMSRDKSKVGHMTVM